MKRPRSSGREGALNNSLPLGPMISPFRGSAPKFIRCLILDGSGVEAVIVRLRDKGALIEGSVAIEFTTDSIARGIRKRE